MTHEGRTDGRTDCGRGGGGAGSGRQGAPPPRAARPGARRVPVPGLCAFPSRALRVPVPSSALSLPELCAFPSLSLRVPCRGSARSRPGLCAVPTGPGRGRSRAAEPPLQGTSCRRTQLQCVSAQRLIGVGFLWISLEKAKAHP